MRTWRRRIGFAAGGLAAVLVLALGGIYGMSAAAVGTGHEASAHALDVAGADVAEGGRLAVVYGCTDCHAADLGGKVMIDDPAFARVIASNLTAGRAGGALTDDQFERAVRHGVGGDGRALYIMPSSEYTYLSDADVANLLAYVRTIPAVERELPARSFGPVGRLMVTLGKVPAQNDLINADPSARHLSKPTTAEPLRLGHYLTRLCTGCHGPDLAGAPAHGPDAPPGANLTPAGNLGRWSLEDFRTVFATGRTPEGKQLDPYAMPWNVIGQASPEEIEAIWTYLQTVEAKATPAAK